MGDGPWGPVTCETAQHSTPGWDSAPEPLCRAQAGPDASCGGGRGAPNSLVPRCGARQRHGTSQTGAGTDPAHLSGSRAETRSSCLRPHTPAARYPAHLQERTPEQVTSLPIAHTMLPGLPPAGTWIGMGHPASQCKPRGLGLSAPLGQLGERLLHSPSCLLGSVGLTRQPMGQIHPTPSRAWHTFPCASPAASALNAIQRQLAFTWLPQDGKEPARIPPIQAWDGEGKAMSRDAPVSEEPHAIAG